jgi:tRNA pseudouridine55 synthase
VRVDGVVFLDKPCGLSSNAALQRARRAFAADRAGHTGTLDPLASGMLPVVLGDAAKFGQALLDADKEYLAGVALGRTTTTGDAEGETVAVRPVPLLDDASLEACLARFRGRIEQIPPMYSALKRDGRPLYAYARRGETVERAARPVTIRELELREHRGETLVLRVRCSKGTYVRTLGEDIGRALGCGAHLSSLRRTAVGPFGIAVCVELDALERSSEGEKAALIHPADTLLAGMPRIELDAGQSARLQQGQAVALEPLPVLNPGTVRAYGPEGRFLGVAECRGGLLHARRLVRQDGSTASV